MQRYNDKKTETANTYFGNNAQNKNEMTLWADLGQSLYSCDFIGTPFSR